MRYKVNPATEQRILAAYAVRLYQRRSVYYPSGNIVNALLQARAETVATTETAAAVMGARDGSKREQQGLDRAVVKTWRHRRGGDGRITH